MKNDLLHKELFTSSAAGKNTGKIQVSLTQEEGYHPGYKAVLTFKNISPDTIWLTNVVPFGFTGDKVFLTGKGDHPLSRSYLFRPGFEPVNCILPDNAWETGFSDITVNDTLNVSAITRRSRDNMVKAVRHRFETEMAPGGVVQYNLYADFHMGSWQEGLRLMFQDRMLYDVEPGKFDCQMLERKDLQWIRHAYVSHLIMAWNGIFYDDVDQKFHLDDFVKRGKMLYGGDDFIGIWPTWPTLGVDKRNQWDLFRDLPGGNAQLQKEAEKLNRLGSRLFICYNPWDESTRSENHTGGMAELIAATHADGVVLDTRGASSKALQQAADSVRKGVIMYSEGMAVPKDMQGIVAGRVHNALYYFPILNLNKIIKPEFAIFRVAEIYKEPIRREFSLSFFNGYGTELNIFAPGIPEWAEEQYRFLGKIVTILPGTPRPISHSEKTEAAEKAPNGMVEIHAGKFRFHATNGDEFIPYPKENERKIFDMPPFFMDKFPVTNSQFKDFLERSGYQSADTANFLMNWIKGGFPAGQGQYPVVYVSYEDAKAYAKWAGKRLPTELEWQYAAQTAACNEWPWKQKQQIRRVEEAVTNTLTIFKIQVIGKGRCNAGDGSLYPVGSYPKRANPYGLQDLVGCVKEL
ncbi:MAG: formylglycine-generating enzyme family protein [Prolixibacteraceae bacterium]|jgi:formylglycine-generating enzyme required for sulfatase activity|nr:formylglycine-generating enzyme family protein [Prolixibacteraceae bacterium]